MWSIRRTRSGDGNLGSLTFSVQAVHHTLDEFHTILQTEVDEVGVDEDSVRWCKSGIVGEEES